MHIITSLLLVLPCLRTTTRTTRIAPATHTRTTSTSSTLGHSILGPLRLAGHCSLGCFRVGEVSKDEEAGFHYNGHKDEGHREDHGVDELPSQEEVAHIVASQSGHEKTEDEGHGVGDGLGQFLDSLEIGLLLEVEVISHLGVGEPQLPDLTLVLEFLDEPSLLGTLLLPLDHELHVVVGDDVVAADLLVDLHSVLGCYTF